MMDSHHLFTFSHRHYVELTSLEHQLITVIWFMCYSSLPIVIDLLSHVIQLLY